MKVFVSVVVAIIITSGGINKAATSCPCHDEDVTSDKFLAIAQCMEEHQISNEAFERIVNHENIPEDREVKCWLSCVMKKLGMIKNGKMDWEQCKMLMKQDLISERDKAKVDKIAEACRNQVSEEEVDECQLAYTAAVCKINHWKELGLPKKNQ